MTDQILSTSAIKLYLDCPYAYYLRYLGRCKPEFVDDTYLRLGKSGHAILQHYYEELDLSNPNLEVEFVEKMKSVAFKYWDRTIDARKRVELEPALFNWIKFELQRFHNYKKQGIEDRFKPVAVEQDLTDYNNRLRAVMDKRCIGSNGLQYVMDYKFDAKLPAKRNWSVNLAEIDIKYKVQAAINVNVLKSQDIEIASFFFQFIRYPDKLLSIPLTSELFSEIDALISKIRADEVFKKNKKGCFMCSLKADCEAQNSSIHCFGTERI